MPFSSASSGRCRAATSWPRRRNSPASGMVDAGDDLHQRRLAGAVLAHQRMHGAALQAEAGHRRARRRPGTPCGHPRPPGAGSRASAATRAASSRGPAIVRRRGLSVVPAGASCRPVHRRAASARSARCGAVRPAAGARFSSWSCTCPCWPGSPARTAPRPCCSTFSPLASFSAVSTAPLPWPAAFWNTVTSRSPAFIAASASCVASTPATTTLFMSACRLPSAPGSRRSPSRHCWRRRRRTAGRREIQLVIRSVPWVRSQLPVCSVEDRRCPCTRAWR